jgi:hypothetical protein
MKLRRQGDGRVAGCAQKRKESMTDEPMWIDSRFPQSTRPRGLNCWAFLSPAPDRPKVASHPTAQGRCGSEVGGRISLLKAGEVASPSPTAAKREAQVSGAARAVQDTFGPHHLQMVRKALATVERIDFKRTGMWCGGRNVRTRWAPERISH